MGWSHGNELSEPSPVQDFNFQNRPLPQLEVLTQAGTLLDSCDFVSDMEERRHPTLLFKVPQTPYTKAHPHLKIGRKWKEASEGGSGTFQLHWYHIKNPKIHLNH
jgi:hypothetical protein